MKPSGHHHLHVDAVNVERRIMPAHIAGVASHSDVVFILAAVTAANKMLAHRLARNQHFSASRHRCLNAKSIARLIFGLTARQPSVAVAIAAFAVLFIERSNELAFGCWTAQFQSPPFRLLRSCLLRISKEDFRWKYLF